MKKLSSPRGCPDWLPEDFNKAQEIYAKAFYWAQVYGFKGYKTPIFEQAEVFTKTLGESSDIITKEMYSFQDKKGETFVLRPEATAPLMRLFISQKLSRELPLKMFTYGPMFRYERPQKGRQRQFHQIGVEHLGAQKDLFDHFELLSLAFNFVDSLEIKSPLKLKLNNLGKSKERESFKEALISYLKPKKAQLSEDSQTRLEQNPLRILDSKSPDDQELLKEAPRLSEFISKESLAESQELIAALKSQGREVEFSPFLVRGLDYYNDLVFELVAESDLGAQNTLLAGGRYDKLVASMGGAEVNSIGWGAGLERLMLLSQLQKPELFKVGLVISSDQVKDFEVTEKIRKAGIPLYYPKTGNFSKRLLKCQKQNCNYVVILGEDEVSKGLWQIKDFSTGEQLEKSESESLSFLKNQLL